MSQLPLEVAEQIAQERRHFAAAPDAFFQAWKRGVQIAGPGGLAMAPRRVLTRRATNGTCAPMCRESAKPWAS